MAGDRPDLYTFVFPPTRATWRELLQSVGQFAVHAGLIVSRDELHPTARACLARLEPFEVSVDAVTAWPGSKFAYDEDFALRYLYSWTLEVAAILGSEPPSRWCNPKLPEDPHLLRADGTVLIGNIAGHRETWAELWPSELDILRAGEPPAWLRFNDYSRGSLEDVERRLLTRWPSEQAFVDDEDTDFVERAVFYVGETYLRAFGGSWTQAEGPDFDTVAGARVCLDRGPTLPVAPHQLIRALLQRRTGHELVEVFDL